MRAVVRYRVVALVILCLVVSLGAARQGQAASVATKRLELKKSFMLRNVDDLDRTLEFAREATAALEEQLEAISLAGAGSLAGESRSSSEVFQRYPEWLMALAAEFEQKFNDFMPLQADERIGGSRYVELVEETQKQVDALGKWLETLESERQAVASRMERLDNAVSEKRLLVDVADLELARELWPEYGDRFRYYGEAVYRDLTVDELSRLQLELQGLQDQQPLSDGLSRFVRIEQQWWSFKIDEFRKIGALAEAFDDGEPGKLDEALLGTIRSYEAAIPTVERRLAELSTANQRLPQRGTLGVLEYQKALHNYYDWAITRYERHLAWLESEAGSLRVDQVELAGAVRREAKTTGLNGAASIQ